MIPNFKTLVLNSDYTPISIFPLHFIPAQDAIVRVFNETCQTVIEYDVYIKTPTIKVKWPAVIVRHDYLKIERTAILRRESLYYRDNKTCSYCRETITNFQKNATIDHVIPRSKKGRHIWENVVLACPSCNHQKGSDSPKDKWIPRIKPYKPTYKQLLKIRRKFPITIYHESWKDFIGNWEADILIKKVN